MDTITLEGLLRFSAGDLAANRDGRLSAAQYRRLRWSGIWRLVVGPILLLTGALLALGVNLAFVSVPALVLAAAGLYLTWRGFAYVVDGMDGAVAYLTAPVRRRIVQTKAGPTYFAHIGPVVQGISAGAYQALPEGLPVHLYYGPGCRTLLSAESASEAEPKPAHPFGPDSAHAWDRLRWSWVLFVVGAVGVLIGAYQVATAHPARAIGVHGTIENYVERHGKSTYRDIYLAGDPNSYSPSREDVYDPPAPPFATLIGRQVVLYVNEGTRDVIAIDDGEQLHQGDWYAHPEHQTIFQAVNGAITAGLSVLAFLVGVGILVFDRIRGSRLAISNPDAAPPQRYAPPTVRPLRASLQPTLLLGLVLAVTSLSLALAIGAAQQH